MNVHINGRVSRTKGSERSVRGRGAACPHRPPSPRRYLIAMAWVVVPAVLAKGAVHKWRLGLVGTLLPLTYVLMQTA